MYLFGSFARDEASSKSDVDLLVEFSNQTGLFGLVSLQLFLEEKFDLRVDIGTLDSLKPYVMEEAQKDLLLLI